MLGGIKGIILSVALLLAIPTSLKAQIEELGPFCVPDTAGQGGTALEVRGGYHDVPDTGTVGCVVIFCAPANAQYDTIPSYLRKMWDTTGSEQLSIPRYFDDVSRGKFRLKVKTIPESGNQAIKSELDLLNWQFEKSGSNFRPMLHSVVARADSLVDFNPYDLVSGIYMTFEPSVDLMIFVMIGVDVPSWGVARGLNSYFDRPGRKLADVNSHGDSLLAYNFIAYAFNPDTASVYTHTGLLVHEFGHCFGWPDTYYNNHSALGSFCGMGLRTFRDQQPSPYNLAWLIRMG